MRIRFKVAYDDGRHFKAGEATSAIEPGLARKLVRVGLAEEVVRKPKSKV